MSVIDSLLFVNLALSSAALDKNVYAFPFFRAWSGLLSLVPALGLFSFVVYKLLKKQLKTLFASLKQKLPLVKQSLRTGCRDGRSRAEDEEGQETAGNNHTQAQLPDRIVHPELYDTHEIQGTC